MVIREPEFSVGIEEEYLLVDKSTRDLCNDPPDNMVEECAALCGGQVTPEFLRSQIEVGTRPCRTIAEALDCAAEVAHARTILERGTSAHRQVRAYRQAVESGMDRQKALQAVVDMLIDETNPDIASRCYGK